MCIELLYLALFLGDGSSAPTFSEQEWKIVQSLSPAVLESDSTNAFEKK